jgi:hypothetical protein
MTSRALARHHLTKSENEKIVRSMRSRSHESEKGNGKRCIATWSGLLPYMLDTIMHGREKFSGFSEQEFEKYRESVVQEFGRMARAADAYNELQDQGAV